MAAKYVGMWGRLCPESKMVLRKLPQGSGCPFEIF